MELVGSAAVVQINIDENPRLAERFGVRGIPAVHLIRQGRSIGSKTGAQQKAPLLEWIRGIFGR